MPPGRPRVVAIDGRSGAGKTTLARRLAATVPRAAIVHTDDVAWFHARFDWVALMREGVLEPVHRGEAVAYRPPPWGRALAPRRGRGPGRLDLVVVEGVGAGRAELTDLLDAAVWVQSDRVVARERGIARDGGDVTGWDEWQSEELPFPRATGRGAGGRDRGGDGGGCRLGPAVAPALGELPQWGDAGPPPGRDEKVVEPVIGAQSSSRQRKRSSSGGRTSAAAPGPIPSMMYFSSPRPHRGLARVLGAHEVGGGGELVGDRGHRGGDRAAVAVDVAAPVDQRREAGAADRDLDLTLAPGAARPVGDHDGGAEASAQRARRAVRVVGQEHHRAGRRRWTGRRRRSRT